MNTSGMRAYLDCEGSGQLGGSMHSTGDMLQRDRVNAPSSSINIFNEETGRQHRAITNTVDDRGLLSTATLVSEVLAVPTTSTFEIEATASPEDIITVFEAMSLNTSRAKEGFCAGSEEKCFAYLDRVQILLGSLFRYREAVRSVSETATVVPVKKRKPLNPRRFHPTAIRELEVPNEFQLHVLESLFVRWASSVCSDLNFKDDTGTPLHLLKRMENANPNQGDNHAYYVFKLRIANFIASFVNYVRTAWGSSIPDKSGTSATSSAATDMPNELANFNIPKTGSTSDIALSSSGTRSIQPQLYSLVLPTGGQDTGFDITHDLPSDKQIVHYLYNTPYICRYVFDRSLMSSKRFKSWGHYAWILHAYPPDLVQPDASHPTVWSFKKFNVSIIDVNAQFKVPAGQAFRYAPKLYDPHVKEPRGTWDVPEKLPNWLRWEEDALIGVPNAESQSASIQLNVDYRYGQYSLSTTVRIEVIKPARPTDLMLSSHPNHLL